METCDQPPEPTPHEWLDTFLDNLAEASGNDEEIDVLRDLVCSCFNLLSVEDKKSVMRAYGPAYDRMKE